MNTIQEKSKEAELVEEPVEAAGAETEIGANVVPVDELATPPTAADRTEQEAPVSERPLPNSAEIQTEGAVWLPEGLSTPAADTDITESAWGSIPLVPETSYPGSSGAGEAL